MARGLKIVAAVCFLAAFQRNAWPPAVQKVSAASPALSPDQAMKTFFLPPGYRLELVASEPLVRDPIVMDQDADGRLYVIEMPAFAIDESMRDSRDPICSVVVLEDTDDDGRMDKRTVFLDKLVLPRAVKVLADGVLVGEPPNLWLAKDIDGDLKADTKDLIRNDFGRAEANIEHNANGLLWGMDNTIYTAEHNWNLRLKRGKFEIEPSLVRGQWNLSMDDAGRIYRNWNEQPLFVDIIPVRYFIRNPNIVRTRGLYDILIERNETAIWPVRPTPGLQRAYREGMLRPDGTATTYASSADPLIFRGDRLPRELYGNAFIGESPSNLVHRLIIDDDGSGRLKARDAYAKGEFLASTDERFRPVNLYSAADGTLYVIDMYRGVVQDVAYQTEYLRNYIKTRKLELPVGLGRIYRVVHQSMKRGPRPSLARAKPAQWLQALTHPNGWWRDTAQQLLVQRGDATVVPELKRLALTARDWRTRLHALWTLDGLDAIDVETVSKTLDDKSPDIRAAAVRISERWIAEPGHALAAAVLRRMDDANWIVRRQLAATLGALPDNARLPALARILERYGDDPITVDAAVSGLAGQEAAMVDRLVASRVGAQHGRDAVEMLSGAISRGRNLAAAQRVFDLAAEPGRAMWQRTALLRGVEMGLPGGFGRGGGGGGAGFGRGGRGAVPSGFAFANEPVSLTRLASTSGEVGELAGRIAARINWPGKPAPVVEAPRLTSEEEKRFAEGRLIYENLCVGCHQSDGRGREKVAPTLVGSRYVTGNPGVATRIMLAGKEGATGLMPPFASGLSDVQIASVLTYVRREWGHTASPVAPADVREIRGLTSYRKAPWKDEELSRLGGRGFGGDR